jgi:transposase, IS5 family
MSTATRPFEASILSHFRPRLSLELANQVNARIVEDAMAAERATPANQIDETTAESRALQPPVEGLSAAEASSSQDSEAEDKPPPPPQGQLILDASVAPADIHYPTDLHLLNVVRASSERILVPTGSRRVTPTSRGLTNTNTAPRDDTSARCI